MLSRPVVVQYGYNNFDDASFHCVDFLKMEEFQRQVEAAKFVIIHGGAGSIITALQAGKVPVVMPRKPELGEHVDNHQIEFADELEKMGRIIVAEDTASLADAIRRVEEMSCDRGSNPASNGMVELVRGAIQEFSK
jgi:UDP-N-acetylglucosamine transferase subunit ALG13